MAQSAKPVQLNPKTLTAFDAYIYDAETEMQQALHVGESFLWSDFNSERAQRVRAGQVVAEFWSGRGL